MNHVPKPERAAPCALPRQAAGPARKIRSRCPEDSFQMCTMVVRNPGRGLFLIVEHDFPGLVVQPVSVVDNTPALNDHSLVVFHFRISIRNRIAGFGHPHILQFNLSCNSGLPSSLDTRSSYMIRLSIMSATRTSIWSAVSISLILI